MAFSSESDHGVPQRTQDQDFQRQEHAEDIVMTGDAIALTEFSRKELLEMRLAFRDRWNKLEAIREIYGDDSDEYGDASNDLMILEMATARFDKFLVQIGDDTAAKVDPDPEVLYVAPHGVKKKVSTEQFPIGFKSRKIKIGEGP